MGTGEAVWRAYTAILRLRSHGSKNFQSKCFQNYPTQAATLSPLLRRHIKASFP